MSEKITIRDVAREAGVGIGTVSRVLNNNSNVSDKTRKHVLEVIERLGYRPNLIARQLPRRASLSVIGVITPSFSNYYSFAERMRGVHQALQPYAQDFELALYSAPSNQTTRDRLNEILESSILAGLLVIDFTLTADQKKTLRTMNVPFVGINHSGEQDWPCIGTDNVEGGYLATRYLLDLGHTRIGYIGNELVDADGFRTSEERYEGYRLALREAGILETPRRVRLGIRGYHAARQMASELLRLPDRPTAIFAMTDEQALGCLAAAREHDLRVPEDLSVIGYDDLELSFHTQLTTVRQHLQQSGEIAMWYLLELLQNRDDARLPTLPELQIIPRGTTDKAPDSA